MEEQGQLEESSLFFNTVRLVGNILGRHVREYGEITNRKNVTVKKMAEERLDSISDWFVLVKTDDSLITINSAQQVSSLHDRYMRNVHFAPIITSITSEVIAVLTIVNFNQLCTDIAEAIVRATVSNVVSTTTNVGVDDVKQTLLSDPWLVTLYLTYFSEVAHDG